MNKSELIAALASRADLTRAQAQKVVDVLFNPVDGIISSTIEEGKRVEISGFGTFEVRARAARIGRDPRTGHTISIPPTATPSFRPGKSLKDVIRGYAGGTHGAGEGE